MKSIITAVGNEELNNILKNQEGIKVEASDIQYQEGIIEALEKYPEVEIIVLDEEIIGELELEDLIRSIIIIKNDIKIILLTSKIQEISFNDNIIKVVLNNENYVKEVTEYLTGEVYIKTKKATKNEELKKEKEAIIQEIERNKVKIQKKKDGIETIRKIKERIEKLFTNKKKTEKIISVIGNAGIRKDKFYINLCKIK